MKSAMKKLFSYDKYIWGNKKQEVMVLIQGKNRSELVPMINLKYLRPIKY